MNTTFEWRTLDSWLREGCTVPAGEKPTRYSKSGKPLFHTDQVMPNFDWKDEPDPRFEDCYVCPGWAI